MTISDSFIASVLQRPGTVTLSGNLPFIQDLPGAGGQVIRQASGHLVFYGPHARRILLADPDGHPLHECEWTSPINGTVKLSAARFYLDWGQWVGIKPEGLVNRTSLDLSKRPGWEHLTREDLRMMSAKAMGVALEEVAFFYGDEDLIIDQMGQATIRQRKDAFFVLQDGRFEHARFMSCMSAMHWAHIDYLPVVELFLSLLPGTGSAAFELIRGLYDDQHTSNALPLRYRGIPTYPSEAAFRLFSQFFTPSVPGGGDPVPVFMDPPRSHEVTWLPAPSPPQRYVDSSSHLCVTVQHRTAQKVTVSTDPTGLSFVPPDRRGFAPCGRAVTAHEGHLILHENAQQTKIPFHPSWNITQSTSQFPLPSYSIGWQAFFADDPPTVEPRQAFSAVLLYPEDDQEIGEKESHPFVADYLEDVVEQDPLLAAYFSRTTRVLIHHFDAALKTCINLERPRDYTVLYSQPEFAQKHAQILWNQFARAGKLDWAKHIRVVAAENAEKNAYQTTYDLIYLWIPFEHFHDQTALQTTIHRLAKALRPGGMAFVAGPRALSDYVNAQALHILQAEKVEDLPSFRMHQTILPRARVNPDLTVYCLSKTSG